MQNNMHDSQSIGKKNQRRKKILGGDNDDIDNIDTDFMNNE
jgi:hypothetical protein